MPTLPSLHITALYAALWTLVFVVLSAIVIVGRNKYKTMFGAGGHPELEKWVRIHGNFAEYVPLALILLALLDLRGADASHLHLVGGGMTVARLSHILGLGANIVAFRGIGILLTLIVLLYSAWMLMM